MNLGYTNIHLALPGTGNGICVYHVQTINKTLEFYYWRASTPKHNGGQDSCRCDIQRWLDKQKPKC